MKKNRLAMVFALVMLAGVFTISAFAFGGGPERYTRSDYTQVSRRAERVIISDYVNVRSEPFVLDDSSDGNTNSYGRKAIKANFAMPVTEIYDEYSVIESRPLDQRNGFFVGILVSDITDIYGWEEIFPKGITKDPDGIVWINCKYVTIEK